MNVVTHYRIKKIIRFLRFRSALVPLASFGSNISWILISLVFSLRMTNLLLLGIIFMAFAVLFQVVTLPVEFNASSRAMNQVVELGLIRNEEEVVRERY